MTKRVNPAVIGAFIVGALALLLAAVMVVGSGTLFRKPLLFVCMFSGDLNGLRVGARVTVRGVQVGTVAAIKLGLSPEEGRLKPDVKGLWLPVIVQIDRSQIVSRGGTGVALDAEGFEDMLQRGMRAQLNLESLLTGLLYIDLDLHPHTPINLVLEPGGRYREIPTIPTTLESVQKHAAQAFARFEQIDFKGLADSIAEAADSIRSLTNSPDVTATLRSLRAASASLDLTLVALRTTIGKVNGHVDPLVASLQRNSTDVAATLAQTRATLTDLQATLDPDAPLTVHLNQTLNQLTETSRSISALSDYLQRNPSALVRGRYIPDQDR
jgi:paraquat-inducible protein B